MIYPKEGDYVLQNSNNVIFQVKKIEEGKDYIYTISPNEGCDWTEKKIKTASFLNREFTVLSKNSKKRISDLEFLERYSSGGKLGDDAPVKKDTNPKDSLGTKKPSISAVPANVMTEVGVAIGGEGGRKYGRHNYRQTGVMASVYYDASWRHISSWWEGEDIDPKSGLNHVVKAIASLVILRDAMLNDMVEDDRPPKSKSGWEDRLQKDLDNLFEMYPDCEQAVTELNKGEKKK